MEKKNNENRSNENTAAGVIAGALVFWIPAFLFSIFFINMAGITSEAGDTRSTFFSVASSAVQYFIVFPVYVGDMTIFLPGVGFFWLSCYFDLEMMKEDRAEAEKKAPGKHKVWRKSREIYTVSGYIFMIFADLFFYYGRVRYGDALFEELREAFSEEAVYQIFMRCCVGYRLAGFHSSSLYLPGMTLSGYAAGLIMQLIQHFKTRQKHSAGMKAKAGAAAGQS